MKSHYSLRRLALFIFGVLMSCRHTSVPVEPPAQVPATGEPSYNDVPQGQLSNVVEPSHYDLEIKLDPAQKGFSGQVRIDLNVQKATDHFYFHGRDLTVSDVQFKDSEGRNIDVKVDTTETQGVLMARLAENLRVGKYRVTMRYDAPFNETLQGLYRVKDGEQFYVFSQMESIYARYAFPSFDEPRFKTTYDIRLVVPDSLKAIANTPEKSTEKVSEGWKRVTFATSKPMPTYLLALAVGDFDIVEWPDLPATEVRGRPLKLRGIATKGKGEGLQYALENTRAILESLEEYFQSEYPYQKLDLLAVPDFQAGAMENPGAITYREQILLLDATSSIAQKRRYKTVHAHELAHQWFGNLVTPVWWNDIWLNEAFATWMASTALHRKWPQEQWKRGLIRNSKAAMGGDSIPSARKVRNPIRSNSDIITAFDGITYSKGGGVLSMIEGFMGEENFRLGVQTYMKKYAWGNADALDFFASIASVLDPSRAQEVVTSFRNFVEQAGVPLIHVSQSCTSEHTILTLNQERYTPFGTEFEEKSLWTIPVCTSYEIGGKTEEQCDVMTKESQHIQLKVRGCADWVMPNQHAAGYYRFSLDSQGWKKLFLNLHKIDASEANAVLDSMKAAFSSGAMSIQDLVDVIPTTLKSDSWEVVASGMSTLGTLIQYAKEEDKDPLRQMAAKMYRQQTNALGFTDNTNRDKNNPLDSSALRTRLVNFMAQTAQDPQTRKALLRRAMKYSGYKGDGKFHDKALIPALRGAAMSVAVQELGKPYVAFLIEQLKKNNDGTMRSLLIGALVSTKDPETAEMLLNLAFSPDIRDNEKVNFLFSLMTEKEVDSVTWPWLKENFDKIISDLSTNFQGYVPFLFMGDCNEVRNQRLDTFLKPRLGTLVGADSNFVKAKDFMRQCLAHKAHVEPQVKQFLQKLK